MSVPETAVIRRIIQGLCPAPSDQITYARLYELFNLNTEPEKARLRGRLRDMLRRGELIRVRPGVFQYRPEHAVKRRDSVGYQRVWRALRSARPGWTMHELAQVTRMSYSMVRKYCLWLRSEGYIVPHGRRGNTRLWRATPAARARQQTPYPPRRQPDPYRGARAAACRLVRCLMDMDPGRPGVRERIVTECRTLLERFGEGGEHA